MISLTAMSSTPLPDRKQKVTTDLYDVQTAVIDVLSVDVYTLAIFSETQVAVQTFIRKLLYKLIDFAVPVDVGWSNKDYVSNWRIKYKEKLLENYDKKNYLYSCRIRNDC
jgi:hypothetical protein